jgi:Spy/CpxP family protein refolding chaperone
MGKDIMESLNLSPEQKESVKAYKLEKGKLKNLIAAEHEEQVAYQALVSQASSTPEALRAQAAKLAAAQAL